jgi:hypothetical protein
MGPLDTVVLALGDAVVVGDVLAATVAPRFEVAC